MNEARMYRDREGDVWQEQPDGSYRLVAWMASLEYLEEEYGPLEPVTTDDLDDER